MLVAGSMRALIVAGSIAIPTLAHANPITIGASLGLSESQIDSDNGADPTHTLGLFGRLGLGKHVAGQLELLQYKSEQGCASCTVGTTSSLRTGTAVLVVDLTDGGTWVPTLAGGIGIDRDDGNFPSKAHHIEGGLGLEYRGSDGLTFGVDLRVGERTIEDEAVALPGGVAAFAPTRMQAGEYRSGRVWLGVRF